MATRAGRLLALAAAGLLLCAAMPLLAQGLPGLGATPPAGGEPDLLARVYGWLAVQQSALRYQLVELLAALKGGEGGALWALVGGAFLYGVVHAAGPGHGKLVISSYLFANAAKLRSGLALTAVSSLLQAVSAILLVGVAVALLHQARTAQAQNVQLLELVSYALIVAIGCLMLWRLLRGREACGLDHRHDHGHAHPHGRGHGHDHGHGAEAIPIRDFWAMALSIGIRPCSGAVIVLLFTMGQGLMAAGIAAAVAMAAGTALTVGLLALLAVGSRRLALRLAGEGSRTGRRLARAAGYLRRSRRDPARGALLLGDAQRAAAAVKTRPQAGQGSEKVFRLVKDFIASSTPSL